MPSVIQEPIKVLAVFDNGIRPVKFKWRGRVYQVREITHFWDRRNGQIVLKCFSVSDGATLFELSYDPGAVSWTLEEVD